MTRKALTIAFLIVAATGIVSGLEVRSDLYQSPATLTGDDPIDRCVLARLAPMGIRPAVCSDAVFVRRVFLDVIGTLPTPQEARDFITNPDTRNKRRVLIDQLLERPEYSLYWAMKWSDLLRIKAEFPVNLWPNAAQAYHRWVLASLAENKPYDKFVREMLTSSGSNFRVGPVNFYRAIASRTPVGIASAVALTFMGSRTDNWSKETMEGMGAFFAQVGYKPTREWKEEVVFWDPLQAKTWGPDGARLEPPKPTAAAPAAPADPNAPAAPADPNAPADANAPATPPPPPLPPPPPTEGVFPDGTKVKLDPDKDPRDTFADWLISPKNPWFTLNIVNRMWSWLLGRGIIHEPDDIRASNPPSNPALLAHLQQEMIASKYDMKRMMRLILNSQTYQLASTLKLNHPQAAANFASYPIRRLDAEVLIDAINKVTGTTDLYTSAIPEPFTYIPSDMPAIGVADGSITSPFLAMFGRSARATGRETERDNKPMAAQWRHLLNSSHIQRKIEQGPKFKELFESTKKPPEILNELYLSILSRFPTSDEVLFAQGYGRPGAAKRREDWIDIAWALLNSHEFVYKH